jgi:glyoxylase-like metal-dependent hydrolase (beta-lactamase superfamily II)
MGKYICWPHSVYICCFPGLRFLCQAWKGHVNVYVLRCKHGYGLVDVGLAAYDGALSLVKGLKALGIKLTEITKVYITHFHADHITLAQFLAEVVSPNFYIGERELMDIGTSFIEDIEETWGASGCG